MESSQEVLRRTEDAPVVHCAGHNFHDIIMVQHTHSALGVCYDTTLIFLEYEIVAMGRRSMNVDVAVMR
jgi:hypothetical protein